MEDLLTHKHNLCKHKDSCVVNIIKQALVALKYGVTIEVILNLVKLLVSLLKRKGMAAVKAILIPSKDMLQIPLFFFMFTLCLKSSYCLIRTIRDKEDNWNPFISGAVAALLSMKFLNKRHWYMVLSLIGARVIDCMHSVACEKGYLNSNRKSLHIYIMFALGNFINAYGYFIEPDVIGNDMFRLWERMANLGWREKTWLKSSYLSTQRNLVQQGASFLDNTFQKRIDDLKQY